MRFPRVTVILLTLILGGFSCAQSPLPPINQPVFRAFDANGQPLAGGKLWSYAAGSSTLIPTYADAGKVSANPNPVILDSSGQAKIFMDTTLYKFVLQDINNVQQWSIDNINGAPPASAVTSVFGRAGAVVAVTGDYTCGQITGAVCSIPTLRYQTVVNNTTTLTQRSKLNFLSGTNITVSCVDNSGADSTDCTTTWVPPTAPTDDVWFSFDTCTIAETGNFYSCAGTYSSTPFPTADGNISVVCGVQTPGPVGAAFNLQNSSLSSTGFSYRFTQIMGNGTSGSAAGGHITCVLHHNS